jgi:hypothetical protein
MEEHFAKPFTLHQSSPPPTSTQRTYARLKRGSGGQRSLHRERTARSLAIGAAERLTPETEQAPKAEAATARAAIAPSGEQAVPELIAGSAAHALFSTLQPERRKRSLGGIDYYEVQPGYYEVWIHGRMVGDVQRLSRAPALGARLYGDRMVAPVTHYQVSIAGTDEVFNSDDIYEALREVARRAALLSPVPRRHAEQPTAVATV